PRGQRRAVPRRRRAATSRAGGSPRWPRAPRGAASATRARGCRRPRSSRHLARAELSLEVLLEDLQRGRRGRVGAEAAVLDQRADDELRRRGALRRPVAAPPRLVELVGVRVLLRGAGLAGDRDREVAEDARRRSVPGVRGLPEAVLHG